MVNLNLLKKRKISSTVLKDFHDMLRDKNRSFLKIHK